MTKVCDTGVVGHEISPLRQFFIQNFLKTLYRVLAIFGHQNWNLESYISVHCFAVKRAISVHINFVREN